MRFGILAIGALTLASVAYGTVHVKYERGCCYGHGVAVNSPGVLYGPKAGGFVPDEKYAGSFDIGNDYSYLGGGNLFTAGVPGEFIPGTQTKPDDDYGYPIGSTDPGFLK